MPLPWVSRATLDRADEIRANMARQARDSISAVSADLAAWMALPQEERDRITAQRKAEHGAHDTYCRENPVLTHDGRPTLPPRPGERYRRMPDGQLACPAHGKAMSGWDPFCEDCR